MPRPKKEPSPSILKGWKAIGGYLGIGEAAAQRWANSGMPVRREGRYTVADTADLQAWLGREAHMPGPAHVVTEGDDISAALKESIKAMRGKSRR